MLIAKLLRPLTTRDAAAAPAAGDECRTDRARQPPARADLAAGRRPGHRDGGVDPVGGAGRYRDHRNARVASTAYAGRAGPAGSGPGRLGGHPRAAEPRRRRDAARSPALGPFVVGGACRSPPTRPAPGPSTRRGRAVHRLAESRKSSMRAEVELGLRVRLRVGEVVGGRQQVRVVPDAVPAGDPAVLGERRPQRRRLAQPARPQFQTDQGAEGLLGGTTGGPTAAERLGERSDIRQPILGGCRPPRAQTQPSISASDGLQPGQRDLLLRGVVRAEDALQREVLHALRIRRVDVAHGFFDGLTVDLDAGGVRLDGAQHVRAQPRHVAEQALVRGFPEGDVEQHLGRLQRQALAVRRDVGRNQRGGAGRPERQVRCRRCSAPPRRASRGPGRAGRRRARHRGPPPSTTSGRADRASPPGPDRPSPPTIRPATGSHSFCQIEMVLLIHSERFHASVVLMPDGSAVASSSQRSASRSVSVTCWRSSGVTAGSPGALVLPRRESQQSVSGSAGSSVGTPKPIGSWPPNVPIGPIPGRPSRRRGQRRERDLLGQVPVDRSVAGHPREHLLHLVQELLHGRGVVGIGHAAGHLESERYIRHVVDSTRSAQPRPICFAQSASG